MRTPKTEADQPAGLLIGYARVSTREQNLAMQVEALQRYGVSPESIHSEHVSAVSAKRHKLEWALRNLREGDTFVVWKLDRLARSVSDLLRRVKQIETAGARLVSLTELIDTKTAVGNLLLVVLGAVAQFERDLIAERTSAGMQRAKAAGRPVGAQPKLSRDQRKQMKAWRKEKPPRTYRWIGAQFGVSANTIRNYVTKPEWRTKK